MSIIEGGLIAFIAWVGLSALCCWLWWRTHRPWWWNYSLTMLTGEHAGETRHIIDLNTPTITFDKPFPSNAKSGDLYEIKSPKATFRRRIGGSL